MAKKRKNTRNEHHVVPNKKEGGWDVKVNNAGRRTLHATKKSVAVRKARVISRRNKTELVIHNSHGKIETSNSHDVVRCRKPGPKPKKSKKAKKTKKSKRR